MQRLVVLVAVVAALSGCAARNQTYQEACFQPADARPPSRTPFADRRTPAFDPVLTVQPTADATYVHCS